MANDEEEKAIETEITDLDTKLKFGKVLIKETIKVVKAGFDIMEKDAPASYDRSLLRDHEAWPNLLAAMRRVMDAAQPISGKERSKMN